jgi:hypothetical protein
MFLKLLILSLIFLALVVAGLGIRMLIRKGSSFPETHVGRNPEMQKMGITCAEKESMGCSAAELSEGCCSCSTAVKNFSSAQ